jgi:hypothetical protein
MQLAGIVKRRQEKNSVHYSVSDGSIFLMCDKISNSLNKQAVKRFKLLTLGKVN